MTIRLLSKGGPALISLEEEEKMGIPILIILFLSIYTVINIIIEDSKLGDE
jgi:hypothetical protein